MKELPISQGTESMPENATTAFIDSWHTYQKVVTANHMFHKEIANHVGEFLYTRFGARPLSFLDLGCGDAATLAPVLAQRPLRLYKGVDLSQPALSLARENLAALCCPVELAHSDVLAALSNEAGVYDLIYSSFAIHHLPRDNKAEIFRQAARCLMKAGAFLLVDVMREEDESLCLYHSRYCGLAAKNLYRSRCARARSCLRTHCELRPARAPFRVTATSRRKRTWQNATNRELQLA